MGWDFSLTLPYVLEPVLGYLAIPSWAQSQYSQYPQDPVSGPSGPGTDSPGYCEYGLRPQLDSTLCPGTCPCISDRSKLGSEPIFTVSAGSCIWIQTRLDTVNMNWDLRFDLHISWDPVPRNMVESSWGLSPYSQYQQHPVSGYRFAWILWMWAETLV